MYATQQNVIHTGTPPSTGEVRIPEETEPMPDRVELRQLVCDIRELLIDTDEGKCLPGIQTGAVVCERPKPAPPTYAERWSSKPREPLEAIGKKVLWRRGDIIFSLVVPLVHDSTYEPHHTGDTSNDLILKAFFDLEATAEKEETKHPITVVLHPYKFTEDREEDAKDWDTSKVGEKEASGLSIVIKDNVNDNLIGFEVTRSLEEDPESGLEFGADAIAQLKGEADEDVFIELDELNDEYKELIYLGLAVFNSFYERFNILALWKAREAQ